jgi:hypothetical protein
MKVLINLRKGFRQTRSFPKMILVLLAVNLILSLLLAVPIFRSLQDSFGSSLVGERMAQGFDYLWWEEYRDGSGGGLADTFTPALMGKGAALLNMELLIRQSFWLLPPLLVAAGLLYIGLRTILSGGILFTYSVPRGRFYLGDFLHGSARYAVRFLGIQLVGWLLLLVAAAPLSGLLDSWVEGIAEKAFSEVTPFYLNLLASLFILLLFLVVQIVMDYARISTVEKDFRSILRAIRYGFLFVVRNPVAVLGLAGTLWLCQIAWTAAYILIRMLVPQGGFPGIAAAFIMLQLFVAGLIWIRCWMYSSQLHLYRFLN